MTLSHSKICAGPPWLFGRERLPGELAKTWERARATDGFSATFSTTGGAMDDVHAL
jgi:hypothetical protein